MADMTSTDVHAMVADIRRNGGIITDDAARTIASWWHSPSPADRAMTLLSHRGPSALSEVDLSDLHDIAAENIAAAETNEDRFALVALTHWVLRRQGH